MKICDDFHRDHIRFHPSTCTTDMGVAEQVVDIGRGAEVESSLRHLRWALIFFSRNVNVEET